jgi:uncharacterized phage protein gp47/JayE
MGTFDGNGLIIDRLIDIKTEMQASLRATFGEGINLAETSPLGILVGIMSERYSTLWEMLEAVYNASFPEQAFGVYLDELCAFNAVKRTPASKSTVVLTFTRGNAIDDGDVSIPAGTQCNAVGSSILWATTNAATILDGVMTITTGASPEDTGAIGAVADSITVMVSAPANVDTVNNDDGANLGSDKETDAALKIRRWTELGRVGTPTEAGIRSALQALDIVTTAIVVLNDTDNTVSGQPPHSVAPYVDLASGGPTDPVIANEIAQTVWDSKGGGIPTYGTYSGTAVDTNGDDQIVYFSTITTVPLWVKVNRTVESGYDYASDAAIQQALQAYSLTLAGGEDVLNYKVTQAAAEVGAEHITEMTTTISDDNSVFVSTSIIIDPQSVAYIPAVNVTFVPAAP